MVTLLASAAGCSLLYENNPRKNENRYAAHAGALNADAPNNSRQHGEARRKDAHMRAYETQAAADRAKQEEIAKAARERDFADMHARQQRKDAEEQERARVAAEEKERETIAERERVRKGALATGVCKATTPVDECGRLIAVDALVGEACQIIADIGGNKAEADRELKDAKRFRVVNLELLQEHKEEAQRLEEALEDRKVSIKDMRGRAFSRGECKVRRG